MRTVALERLGIPGVTGAGLLLFCLAFYCGSLSPAESVLASLQRDELGLTRQLAGIRGALGGSMDIALPSESTIPDLLKQLSEAAEQCGLGSLHFSYRMSTDEGVRRYEITMPMRGTYPNIRAYLGRAMTLTFPATLDAIELQRATAVDGQIDAQSRLSYYFAP